MDQTASELGYRHGEFIAENYWIVVAIVIVFIVARRINHQRSIRSAGSPRASRKSGELCSTCGASNTSSASFCHSCGARLSS